jgi:hypothetical protein
MSSPSGARKSIALVLWGLLALCLALQVLRMRIAESAVRGGDAITASAVRPQNGQGLALLAERQLRQGNAAAARGTSAASLTRTPLTATGARTLAMSLEKLGKIPESEAAWQIASQLGWRDSQTQLWAMLRALANQQPDIFAMRADALLRTNNSNEAVAIVRRLLGPAPIRDAFVDRIKINPPWRAAFFHWDGVLPPAELNVMIETLRELGREGAVPSRRDLRQTMASLIAARRFNEAIQLDRAFVRRTADAESVIDDGGLTFATEDYRRNLTPFDWMLPTDQATMDESGGQRSILVTANGGIAAHRYVALAPGNYEISYEMWGDPQAPANLGLTVRCNNDDRELGSSDHQLLVSGQHSLRRFQITVTPDCAIIHIMMGQFWSGTEQSLLVDNIKVRPKA